MISVSTGGINPALLNPLPEASAPVAGSRIPQLDTAQLMQKKMGAPDEMTKKLAAMGLTSPANASASAPAMEAMLKALGDSSGFVGTDIQGVMELFAKLASEQRTAAMAARLEAMQGQADALQGAADKIKQAAQDRIASAIAQGALQIASGVIQMGSAVAGRMNGDAMLKAAQAADSQSQIEANSKLHDLAISEADARVREAFAQSANDMMPQMMDVIRDIRDKLASLSQIESSRGLIRNV
ncbi:hypothetical protein [Achromobacter sp. Bel]|uniref:hypothetical protein n=1 Tax=Achromobacter sp. Bel TaxID=2727415 RepID=UPI00145C6313|nr:hypothetical protein [Achromobacter sp. Bel]NMK47573.1 hypothetical protein [Achromobacter sp. Bel]